MSYDRLHSVPGAISLRTPSRQVLTVFAVALFSATRSLSASVEPPLATPAIDDSLFKDGAVVSREEKFDAWYAKCQEIAKAKRRICNLLSIILDKSGKEQGSVLVATTDNGVPAMMIALTASVLRDHSIVVEATYKIKSRTKSTPVTFKMSIAAMRCDTSCKFMFPLDPKLVYALNEGYEINVKVPLVTPSDAVRTNKRTSPNTLALTIQGAGFAAALKASTTPW